MKVILKKLTNQLKAQGIEPDQIKPKGKTAITMAYLDPKACHEVAGGLNPGEVNFWRNTDFAKNG